MSPPKRRPYSPDECALYLTRAEACKLIDVSSTRAIGDLCGYWLIPEAAWEGKAAYKVYRMADILALTRRR